MEKHTLGFLDVANDAKSRIEECDVHAVKTMLDTEEDCQLIDVREESEWAVARLPTAIHLSKGVIERDIEKVIPDRNKKLVLYCGGGFRSALAADNIQKMGYCCVVSMNGGFRGWKEAGFSVEE